MPTNYGYIRVSSRDQHIDRQADTLAKIGLLPENIFIDRQSGKDFNRPGWKKLLRRLKKGDCLYVDSLDRFGRNYTEIRNQWNRITNDKECDIVVCNIPLLDTRVSHENLTGRFIADMVLQILSFVAESERTAIHERQAAGIASAKARGVRFGRPKIDVPDNFAELCRAYQAGEIKSQDAGRRLGVSHVTFLKWVRDAANTALCR